MEWFNSLHISDQLRLIAIFLSIFAVSATVIGVIFTIYSQRDMARKRATLDLIIKSESEDHFKDGYDAFAHIHKNKLWSKLLEPHRTEETQLLKNKVDEFLNHYELVAIGIANRSLDDKTYKRWMRKSVIGHYYDARKYIEGVRTDPNKKKPNNKAYVEFEALALRWQGKNYHTKYKKGEEPRPDTNLREFRTQISFANTQRGRLKPARRSAKVVRTTVPISDDAPSVD